MNFVRCLATLAVLFCWLEAAQGVVEVRDDAGRQIRLAAPARRIVSLAPHATEMLFAAGAGQRVLAVAAYSDYPPAAVALPQIGDAHAIDLERVLALAPDLVVAWISGNNRAQVERLVTMGLTVFMSEPRHADDVATTLLRLGRLAGTDDAAEVAAARFRSELAAFDADYRSTPPFRLFYEIWHQPLMTLNGEHLVSHMLARCGARNVFGGERSLVPTVSLEAVIAATPEAIASGAGPEALAYWRARSELPAQRRVCATDPVRLHRAGPRLVQAAREACACLAPHALPHKHR